MFGNAFSGWHLVIILVIVLLLFGAPKLPGLARSVGQSMRIFKSEVKSMKAEGEERSKPRPRPRNASQPTPVPRGSQSRRLTRMRTADRRKANGREKRMSIGQHLIELRKRLFISAVGIIVAMVIGFVLSEVLIEAMSSPVLSIAETRGEAFLNFTSVTSAFDLRMKIALTVGVVLSSPVWLYQVWAYLVPALNRREIGYAVGFLGAAVPLFLLGCGAGWFVLPHIVELMLGFTPGAAANFLDATTYYDFVLKLTLAVGVAFVLPVFLVLLNFVGVLQATTIIRGWRVALLLIVLFTAFATPAADVMSMLLLAIPMVVLYFAAYGVAYLHDRRASTREQRDAQFESPELSRS